MAAPAPITAKLMAIITTLQVQITALQNAAPAGAAAPTAGAATAVFANMPQMLGANDLIDYLTKRGSTTFEQGCKPLNDKTLTAGFAMTPNQTVIFVKTFHCRVTTMDWNQGAMQITSFANSAGHQVDIIKCYGQIDEATLKSACDRFWKPGEVHSQTWAKQNNTMMSICLAKLLMADTQARLFTYRNKYTFNGVEHAPLMYKIIMRLATIDSVATTQMLHDNLQSLGTYAATVSSDIDKVHSKFDKNYSQLIARGATIHDPIGILFEAYLVVPCHHFMSYICQQHEDYLAGKLTTITQEALMMSAKRKFDWLKTKGLWGAKSPDNEKFVSMTAALNALKGQLKLDPKLSAIANEGKKKGNKKDKKKNKKNNYNPQEQKKDEAWKEEPPKDSEKREKEVGKYTYHWCEHHMVWTVHKPPGCLLGKQHKEDQKKKPQKANSITFAAAAAMAVNPQLAALVALIADLDE
jgi:hypothetical protein